MTIAPSDMARFADLSGARICFEMAGTGPALLVINGSGSDMRRRPGLLDSPLVRSFTVLTYDHRGLGRSTSAADRPTMLDFGRDALELCQHLGWDRYGVLGLSFGGMVAQELALAAAATSTPDQISRLVLACTSSGGAGGASAPLHEIYQLPLAQRAQRLAVVNDLRCVDDEARRDAVVAFITSTTADEPLDLGFARQLEARRLHDTFDRLPALRVPTLVAAGRHDGIAPLVNAEALTSQIPGAVMQVFEGGHGFVVEDRAAFRSMGEFLLAD